MPLARRFTKNELLNAMDKTKSVRSAARYLNVSYTHVKKWLKFYKDEETGKTLFELHKNPSGKGIPKFLANGKKDHALLDIIEGRIDISNFKPEKIKSRLITEGLLEEKCKECSFQERRVLDYKIPLILHFKDGNKKNYKLDNIELLCYNCYFLTIGDVFTKEQIEQIEDYVPKLKVKELDEKLEVDPYHLERLKELGASDSPKTDPNTLLSWM